MPNPCQNIAPRHRFVSVPPHLRVRHPLAEVGRVGMRGEGRKEERERGEDSCGLCVQKPSPCRARYAFSTVMAVRCPLRSMSPTPSETVSSTARISLFT